MALSAVEIISTEDGSVHIRARDEDLPVDIYIERSDIDTCLGLSDDDVQYKRDFIAQNIDVFRMIADARYQKGLHEKAHSRGTDAVRIDLTSADLKSRPLITPHRRLG